MESPPPLSVKVKVEDGKVYVTTDNKVSLIPLWFYFMVQYNISWFFFINKYMFFLRFLETEEAC